MKRLSVLCVAVLLCLSFLNAKEIAGVTLPEHLSHDTLTLTLQGVGVRDKLFLDLYVAGLYTEKPSATLLHDDVPMSMTLHITSSLITSQKMEEATREGFDASTHHATKPLQSAIDTFIAVFKEPIVQKDVYEFFYLPQHGVSIFKNGVLKQRIEGLAFKEALFGIWLGDAPVQESLKHSLLGK